MNEVSKARPEPGPAKATAAPTTPLATPNLPARQSFTRLKDCTTLQAAFQTDELKHLIAQAAPDFMKPEAMLRTWIQAATKQPLIYQADLRQALGVFQSLAYLGLVPNTHLQHAHVLPFKRRKWNPKTKQRDIEVVELQVIIGYPGYIELGYRSGNIRSIHCDVVYDQRLEGFSRSQGSNKHLEHVGMPADFIPNGPPELAYAFVRLQDDDQFEVMTWHEVLRIRNRSQAYQTALRAKEAAEEKGWSVPVTWTEAPWVRDEAEMGKKTALRRIFKWLPKCPELRAAAALEDAQDRGRLDFGPVIDGDASPLDGNIPDMPDDEPPPKVDPGTAFGDRRTGITQTPAPTTPDNANRMPAGAHTVANPTTQPNATNPPSRQPTDIQGYAAPGFEAVLLDEDEVPVRDDPFDDPVVFARACVDFYAGLDAVQAARFLDVNADSIEDARQYGNAAGLLVALDEPPVPRSRLQAVIPPADRGKLSWPGYVRAIKSALPMVPQGAMGPWLDLQRAHLAEAPPAQRMLAIKAIGEVAQMQGVALPPWVADLVKAPAAPKPERQPSPPPTETPAPAPALTRDEAMVANWEAQLQQIAAIPDPHRAREAFLTLVENGAVQEPMKRLRRDNRALFTNGETAFNTVLAGIDARIAAGRAKDSIPYDDPDDPGPEAR